MLSSQKNHNDRGFIKTITIIIVVLVIANFLGFSPELLWDKFFSPAIDIIWKIAVWGVGLLSSLIKIILDLFHVVSDMITMR